MLLFFIWMALMMTGCTRREDIFLEEIASDGETENAEEISKTENTSDKENKAIESPDQITEIPQKIYVDVCGAVVSPGVYELDEGARIFQAVDAAGGYLPEAAVNYLNRARSIADGQQIYVPTEAEVEENLELISAKVPEASGNAEEADGKMNPDGKTDGNAFANAGDKSGTSEDVAGGAGDDLTDTRINLNTADAGQLSTLSGIGQSKAEAIIAYREEHGGFTSIEEIMNVEGIKEGTFLKIKDKISAG